jgi:hypothetical protein
MSDNNQDSRRQAVADALREVLEDGEEFYVRCEDDEVVVTEAATRCQEEHPRLYGHLLSLNEQLAQAGGSSVVWGLLAAGVFCLGLHLEWFDPWLGGAADALRSGWFYALFFVAAALALGAFCNQRARAVYRDGRDHLLSLMLSEGLDRDLLLTLIHGDPAVARVAEHLKLDRHAGGLRP